MLLPFTWRRWTHKNRWVVYPLKTFSQVVSGRFFYPTLDLRKQEQPPVDAQDGSEAAPVGGVFPGQEEGVLNKNPLLPA